MASLSRPVRPGRGAVARVSGLDTPAGAQGVIVLTASAGSLRLRRRRQTGRSFPTLLTSRCGTTSPTGRGDGPIRRSRKYFSWDPAKGKLKTVESPKTKDIEDPDQRRRYEAISKDGRLVSTNGTPLDTSPSSSKFSGSGFAIYVMAPTGQIYVGTHIPSLFHHTTFLSGGNTACAGEIKIVDGKVVALTNKSGHYKSDEDNMEQMLRELAQRGHDLSSLSVKVLVTGEEKIAEVTGVNAADWMKSRLPRAAERDGRQATPRLQTDVVLRRVVPPM